MSPRLDSPLPAADSSMLFWPTLPPRTVARTTNSSQPRIAVLRCCALHRPARAARLRDCIQTELLGRGQRLVAASQRKGVPDWGQTGLFGVTQVHGAMEAGRTANRSYL